MVNLFDPATLKVLAQYIKDEKPRLAYNAEIFMILEGNLKTLLEAKMREDLGTESTKAAITRQAVINYFRKVIDKLTAIYSGQVIRRVEGGREEDQKLVDWYVDVLSLDRKLDSNNEFYNSFLYALLQIGLKQKEGEKFGKPFIRSIPNHQFLIWNDPYSIDPTEATVVMVFCGKYKDLAGKEHEKWALYSDHQYVIINDSGDILRDEMAAKEQDGKNIYGAAPFSYANASENLVMPLIQTDNKEMAILVPLLLTDLNYAVKFQCFSMFIAIDMEEGSVKLSPNSIQWLYTKKTGEKPDFKVVKPEVDIADVLNLAASEIGLWLSSKGIRPGAIGQLGADQFASGVSKMIEESDTYEAKQAQIKIYQDFEADFWERLLRNIHPVWVSLGLVENKHMLSEGAYVVTEFGKPVPLQTRGELVKDLDAEVQAGFTTTERAIKKLNPEMSDVEVAKLIKEIQDSKPKIEAAPFEEQPEEVPA